MVQAATLMGKRYVLCTAFLSGDPQGHKAINWRRENLPRIPFSLGISSAEANVRSAVAAPESRRRKRGTQFRRCSVSPFAAVCASVLILSLRA